MVGTGGVNLVGAKAVMEVEIREKEEGRGSDDSDRVGINSNWVLIGTEPSGTIAPDPFWKLTTNL